MVGSEKHVPCREVLDKDDRFLLHCIVVFFIFAEILILQLKEDNLTKGVNIKLNTSKIH